MNTFKHLFGYWKEADARRWRNPDGSEGGIVATSASVPESVTIPVDCVVWPDAKISSDGASIGYGASIGDGAQYDEGDWLFVLGPQGSRGAWATAVYSVKIKQLRWWVGCKHAISTDRLRELVEESHGATARGDDYCAAIDFVENHPGLKRAQEKSHA